MPGGLVTLPLANSTDNVCNGYELRRCCSDANKEVPARWRRIVRIAARAGIVGALSVTIILSLYRDGIRRGERPGVGSEGVYDAGMGDSTFGIAASSSMWDGSRDLLDIGAWSDEPSPLVTAGTNRRSAGFLRRGLLFDRKDGLKKLTGGGGGAPNKPPQQKQPPVPQQKRAGEPAMLNNFKKAPLDYLDLDDVKEGHLWIPVAVEAFEPSTEDPLVKMCQVDYSAYSEAPWLLPMGGLLALHSGCAEIERDTVQLLRMSVLEKILANGTVPVSKPTGFIFHETRCGSTLVANMLASVRTNIMWSESTGPWKVMHTCQKCGKAQIVRFLKVVIDAMSRSPNHDRFYFKFQSSEDIDAVTTAFPDVPWIFIFREPVEVMMSRLGAQRIGMEGMEKEVAARVEKGINTPQGLRTRAKTRTPREAQTAIHLRLLCQKAITAFEAHPGMGMMVEYPHLPEGIVTTVLPEHFKVSVSPEEHKAMMDTTRMYSKVASFAKTESKDSKFTGDTSTKHDAASVAVTDAAQKFLYSDYYKLRSMQTWPDESES